MLGSLGDVIFEVAEGHVKTFRDLSFERSAAYAEHKILGRETLLEFTGHNAATCSLKIALDVTLGINPKKECETLRKMMTDHEAVVFVIDGALVGTGYWVIERMSESIEVVDNFGGFDRITAVLQLKEYQ